MGRERELGLLHDAFERARAGHGQIVFVAGEPGIGKSRLLLEFRRRLGGEGTWVEGHCMSFGRSIAFHPLIDLLKRTFRIEEGDGEAAIARKIDRSVLGLGEDLRPTLPYLRYLLSVDPGDASLAAMDPQQRRGEIFDAVRRLTMRAAEVHPQVCVFEDLHWMDRATQDYLVSVADSVAGSRVLLVLTYRPGFTHPFGERSYHTRLALNALSGEDSAHMAQGVLAVDALPADLQRVVVGKAQGQPVLHRGGGQVAPGGRRAAPRRRPLRAGPAARRDHGARLDPGRDHGAHRSAGASCVDEGPLFDSLVP